MLRLERGRGRLDPRGAREPGREHDGRVRGEEARGVPAAQRAVVKRGVVLGQRRSRRDGLGRPDLRDHRRGRAGLAAGGAVADPAAARAEAHVRLQPAVYRARGEGRRGSGRDARRHPRERLPPRRRHDGALHAGRPDRDGHQGALDAAAVARNARQVGPHKTRIARGRHRPQDYGRPGAHQGRAGDGHPGRPRRRRRERLEGGGDEGRRGPHGRAGHRGQGRDRAGLDAGGARGVARVPAESGERPRGQGAAADPRLVRDGRSHPQEGRAPGGHHGAEGPRRVLVHPRLRRARGPGGPGVRGQERRQDLHGGHHLPPGGPLHAASGRHHGAEKRRGARRRRLPGAL
mmetsp:Transcript_13677/g.40777  ORF Transcript_13677/g.40777 Transcript_13677/m.40777 type:complete len:347 (+) Transcript_13677:1783-2823(+)